MVDAVVGALGAQKKWDGPRSVLCLMLQMKGGLSWRKCSRESFPLESLSPLPGVVMTPIASLLCLLMFCSGSCCFGNLQGEWPARHSLVSRQHPLVVKRLSEARRF